MFYVSLHTSPFCTGDTWWWLVVGGGGGWWLWWWLGEGEGEGTHNNDDGDEDDDQKDVATPFRYNNDVMITPGVSANHPHASRVYGNSSVLNGALWDMEQMHSVICEICLFCRP